MQLLYDTENDVLDVIFKDAGLNGSQAGYELRQGVVLYVTAKMSPLQLTVVNFRRLTQLPVIHFDRLEKQPNDIRKKLFSRIAAPPLSSLLRIDPATNYGHIMSPVLLDVCAV
ncbi:MAG: hypothetical protein ACREOI_24055 [bacterium]